MCLERTRMQVVALSSGFQGPGFRLRAKASAKGEGWGPRL